MFRLILPVIIFAGGPLSAQSLKTCPTSIERPCDQILACIGTDGQWFSGIALGFGPLNSVVGTLDNGIVCTGQRMHYSKALTGQITLECADGSQGTVVYENHAPHQTYGTGHAQLDDGRAIEVWVAQDIKSALRVVSGDDEDRLLCPDGAMRLD